MEAALAESPGVVVLNSHFGNWELTGGCLDYDHRPDSERSKMEANDIIAVYKPLSSKMRRDNAGQPLRSGAAGRLRGTKNLAAQSGGHPEAGM